MANQESQKPPAGAPPADKPKKASKTVELKGGRTVEIPTGELSIRALKNGFRRNGKRFSVHPQNFVAEDLKWTPIQWKEALQDPTLIFADPVTDAGDRFGTGDKAKLASMTLGGTPGERTGLGSETEAKESGA